MTKTSKITIERSISTLRATDVTEGQDVVLTYQGWGFVISRTNSTDSWRGDFTLTTPDGVQRQGCLSDVKESIRLFSGAMAEEGHTPDSFRSQVEAEQAQAVAEAQGDPVDSLALANALEAGPVERDGCRLALEGDSYVMTSRCGERNTLWTGATTPARLLAHWDGFVSNTRERAVCRLEEPEVVVRLVDPAKPEPITTHPAKASYIAGNLAGVVLLCDCQASVGLVPRIAGVGWENATCTNHRFKH
ncbi:TPA: hypothetical protein ACPWIK_004286 [Pseudomonas aeruginosa]